MDISNICTQCGSSFEPGVELCPNCNAKIDSDSSHDIASQSLAQPSMIESTKSPVINLLLCLFLGMFGAHRFYVGKIGTGLLMLITFGGLGIWYLVDLISIVTNKFEDSKGHRLELTKSPSGFKKGLMVVGAVIAWIATYVTAIIAMVLYFTSGLVAVVTDQLAALSAGNIEKAYVYTSKDFQKRTSIDGFKQFINDYPSLKNNESWFFNNRAIENNMGMLAGTLTSKDGAKTPISYRLIWEDGAWRILGIQVIPTGAGIKVQGE